MMRTILYNNFARQAAIAACLALPLALAAQDQVETTFSYSSPTKTPTLVGYEKAEPYDVCILVKGEEFTAAGAKVSGVNIPVVKDDNLQNYSVWIASSLGSPQAGKVFNPDKCSYSVEPVAGYLTFSFPEPVELPKEGLYVGYSFEVTENGTAGSDRPICATSESANGGLYMRTRDYAPDWFNEAMSSSPHVSMMEVKLLGNFESNSVEAASLAETYTVLGNNASMAFTVANNGVSTVSEIGYTVAVGESSTKLTKQFVPAISARKGASQTFNIDLDCPAETGLYPVTVTINTVNGKDNQNAKPAATANLCVVDHEPVLHVVMEEFTGTWCMWCPMGFAGIEILKKTNPNCISLSYHSSDPMEIKENFPSKLPFSYPSAWLDRITATNPYHGNGTMQQGPKIVDAVNAAEKRFTPAEVSVTAAWDDDDARNEVKIDSEVMLLTTPAEGVSYRLGYVLLSDQISGDGSSSYFQKNTFSGNSTYATLEGLKHYVDQPSVIPDMVYDDVVIYSTPVEGLEGSLPAEITGGQAMTHSYTIKLEDCLSATKDKDDATKYAPILYNKDYITAVVLLFKDDNGTVTIENANRFRLFEAPEDPEAAVKQLPQTSEVASVSYFDMQGRPMARPAKGLPVVKVVTLSDGSTIRQKLIL